MIIHATFAALNFSSGSHMPGVSGKNAPIAATSATKPIRITYRFLIFMSVLSVCERYSKARANARRVAHGRILWHGLYTIRPAAAERFTRLVGEGQKR